MSLIIATGSNLGDSILTLEKANAILAEKLTLIAKSSIYCSKAIEYEGQPDFFNQVLEFKIPSLKPIEVMTLLLKIEEDFGRIRDIPKGPRTLDLDIILWGLENINSEGLVIPHPRWLERSFVIRPLQELPFFQTVEKWFTIPKTFSIDAIPVL